MSCKDKENLKSEPLAIVGIGCRLPGGINNPEIFWDELCQGKNKIIEVPSDRWDLKAYYDSNREKPGKVYTRKGGFLENISYFDPQFFGISPREASFMDPQQRILLEVTWEALEDAGIPPASLAGSKVGVFIGLFMHDFENVHNSITERNNIGPHSATGMSTTIAANRISYVFDFKGPSMIIDTACSSSLVAVHLACKSLLSGESELAVVGGANILLKPEMTIALCKGSFLSEDGYCKSFDARADGYVRSEGAGVVIIKRLSDALAAKDPIYSLILGTAVNQDGKSNGLTVPDANSQMSVIKDALDNAGVLPSDIQYVEAHGTGTSVGDPIEANALGTILSIDRQDSDSLVMGSVKSNIGHTESAAGVASLIKTSLMLKKRKIPPNLHFTTPNPKIPFEELKLRVPTSLEEWPDTNGQPRRAGVNSFGFGGTNAHAVLQEYVINEVKQPVHEINNNDGKAYLVPISAHSKEALDDMARSYIQFVGKETSDENITLPSIGYSASLHKSHHSFRLAAVARSKEEFSQLLEAYLTGEKRTGISYGQARNEAQKLAFVFSGMGPQWWGMGRQLYRQEPVFRKVIETCSKLFEKHTQKWRLLDELLADEGASRIHETQISQPCIFSVQAALFALWNSWGIKPAAITGHSVGEIAAYYAAGVLTLEDAVTVCYHRSRLQQLKAGQGGMLAVGMSREEAEELVEKFHDKVSVAAVNSRASLTLAGDIATLEEISKLMERENKFARFLRVEVPYHSYVMDSILSEFQECLSDISPQSGNIPVVSTVTGRMIEGRQINAGYWAQNVRNTVLFEAAFSQLIKNGFDKFIEVSSHPVLKASMLECLDAQGKEGTIIPSLRRMEDEEVVMQGALGQLYTIGYPVDWNLRYPEKSDFIRLPSYKWQRENYWRESEETRQIRLGLSYVSGNSLQESQKHPLLGGRLKAAFPVWNSNINLNNLSYLKDHVVQESIVFPGAAYVEMAMAAAGDIYGVTGCLIENIEIKAPLILTEEKSAVVQFVVGEDKSFDIYSKQDNSERDWTLHARGRLGYFEGKHPRRFSLEEIKVKCGREKAKDDCYNEFAKRGLEYGTDFQAIEKLWLGEDEALARIKPTYDIESEFDNYQLHPTILDAGFQTMASIKTDRTYLPVKLEGIKLYAKPGNSLLCHARLLEKTGNRITGTIRIFDDEGNLIVEVNRLHCQLVQEAGKISEDNINKLLYEYEWKLYLDATGNEFRQLKTILPSPAKIAEKMEIDLPELIEKYGRRRYYEVVEPAFDRLCAAYIINAFEKLGFELKQGSSLAFNELIAQLGIIPEQAQAFQRFLEILAEDHILKREGNKWVVVRLPVNDDYHKIWNNILKDDPEYHTELRILDRCASRLGEILKGEEDPLSYIFSKSSLAIEQFYRNSPTMRIYNSLVLRTVGQIIDSIPKERTLRILEIGAGTGSLTSCILPILPSNRTEYFFTDISGSFTLQAQQHFRGYDFVEYKVLDIEKDPCTQGFDPHSFDIILASDAIHATSCLKDTMANVRKLLAPAGMLIFIEQVKITRWFDLVFGLLKGWWLFSDHDIRPGYPLMKMNNWKKLLKETGFTNITFLPSKELEFIPQHSVIIARGPESVKSQANEVIIKNDEETKQWIILADDIHISERLAALLESAESKPVLVYKGSIYREENPFHIVLRPDQPGDYVRMLDAVCKDKGMAPGVVNMWSITKPKSNSSIGILEKQYNNICLSTLYLMQALIKKEWVESPCLWNITNGVQPVEDVKSLALEQAPVWGLNRVLISEHPNIKTHMLDLSAVANDREIELLYRQLLHDDKEDEIAIRDGRRYVHRLKRKDYPGFHSANDIPYVVKNTQSKSFEGLEFVEVERKKPKQWEVEVRIYAAGVNFKDVAKLTGLLENTVLADKGLLSELGLECSGIIVDIGEDVKRFQVGDEVMGLAVNCFANYITLDERVLVRKPANINFEGAATIPLAFLSSYYALNRLAGVQKGDRVLIHTATGGVGLAALQIALAFGAEVLATAGTPEKRDFLKSMGIKYVGDSRTLKFADEIMDYTKNEGVDIILNTLPENAVEKNMSVLKPVSGRFIDLSNIYKHSIKIYSLDKGISFHTFDMDSMIKRYPQIAGDMLKEIANNFANEIYHPVPYTVFPISDLSSALGSMRKGLHIGKIVVSITEPGVVPIHTSEKIPVNSEGTYLLTGGLGGFGLAVAQWLADCGARNMVLVGRSGASKPEARSAISKLEQRGIRVVVECADISKEENVTEVLARIEERMPPLKGIIHMAMVLEDAFLAEMDETRMKKVMDPKILGAWNLHLKTLDKKLDFFICFSSFASMVGNTDQGNYVAANAFLDLLSTYRHGMNLPALTVCWGPIGDAGYVAQRNDIKEHFRRQGFDEVHLSQAWKAISLGLENKLDTIGIVPADWKTAARYNSSIGISPRYSRLVKISEKSADAGKEENKIIISSAMTAEERREKLTEVLSREIAVLLGLPVSKLDIQQSLSTIGFDSLMAVELVVRIEEAVNIKIPKMKLLKGGLNIKELVALVEKEILQARSADTDEAEEAVTGKSDNMSVNVNELSDQEVEKLLSTMLSAGEGGDEKF